MWKLKSPTEPMMTMTAMPMMTMPRFFNFKLDQRVIRWMHIFGFTAFAQVVIGAHTAFEANTCVVKCVLALRFF